MVAGFAARGAELIGFVLRDACAALCIQLGDALLGRTASLGMLLDLLQLPLRLLLSLRAWAGSCFACGRALALGALVLWGACEGLVLFPLALGLLYLLRPGQGRRHGFHALNHGMVFAAMLAGPKLAATLPLAEIDGRLPGRSGSAAVQRAELVFDGMAAGAGHLAVLVTTPVHRLAVRSGAQHAKHKAQEW